MIPVAGTKGQLAETKRRPQRYRVVLVDESELTYIALRAVFARSGTFGVAAWATSVREGQRVAADLRPDIVLADVEIAGDSGLTLCAWIRSNVPTCMPVVLTARNDAATASVALGAGAAGYLLTSSPPDDLLFYLQGAVSGQLVVDDRLAPAASPVREANLRERFGLSSRENEVLEEVLRGMDNHSIAQRLCISRDTVKTHVKAILRKTGARDRAQAIAVALGTRPEGIPNPRAPQ